MKNKVLYILIVGGIVLHSCKTPQATVQGDSVKSALPIHYQGDSAQSSKPSIVPWKQFFTDPHLVTLIDTALANNQDLRITLQQIAMAQSDVLYRSGRLLPTVIAGAGLGVNKPGRYTSEGAGNATTDIKPGKAMPDPLMDYNLGVQASWDANLWNKLGAEKRAAVEHYLATVEGRNDVLSSLISMVAGDYYQLLALDNKLDIVHTYIELQRRAVEIAKIQKIADADTELAVQKFEAELAKASSDEYTVKQEIIETENALNLLLGRYPESITRDKTMFFTSDLQRLSLGVPAQLLDNRPDIRQAEHELAATKWNVEAARKEFFPSLNISAAIGLDAFNPTYLTKLPQSLAFSVVGGLTAPLINRTAIQANFKSADAQQIEALYQYDKTLLTAYAEVCNLMSKIDNLGKYFDLKKKESQTLDKSVEVARELYLNGRANYLDVLLDQRDALDARLELLEARQQQLSTMVEIYRSLGGGWQ